MIPPYRENARSRRDEVALRYGLDMTVAIVVFPKSKDEIISISDARLSYGEIIPAADEGTMKNIKITKKWSMMFAAEDSTAFAPVLDKTMEALATLELKPPQTAKFLSREFRLEEVMKATQQAYEKEFNERIFRDNLARFGFADIGEFRKFGYAEMGKDLYHEYSMKLAKFDLGLELLVYGFDQLGARSVFEVANPGKIINHTMRGYAAIGSGTLMALAALNKKPLGPTLPDAIYRILDAKFSAETAKDVGKTTHGISLNKKGENGYLTDDEVEKLHQIWEKDLARPHPKAAINIIKKCDLIVKVTSKVGDASK